MPMQMDEHYVTTVRTCVHRECGERQSRSRMAGDPRVTDEDIERGHHSYGWRRSWSWHGGWLCREHALEAQEFRNRLAPYVGLIGICAAIATVGLLVKGGL